MSGPHPTISPLVGEMSRKRQRGVSEARHIKRPLIGKETSPQPPVASRSANSIASIRLRSIGNPFAGDVEGRAVVDGGADDRQAEGDVDAGEVHPFAGGGIDLEAQQLDRDMPLIVIHGDDGVVLAGAQLDEDGVAGDRADDIEPVFDRLGDRRRGNVDILPAEQAAFAGMRIERRDRDFRPRDAEVLERLDPSGR